MELVFVHFVATKRDDVEKVYYNCAYKIIPSYMVFFSKYFYLKIYWNNIFFKKIIFNISISKQCENKKYIF